MSTPAKSSSLLFLSGLVIGVLPTAAFTYLLAPLPGSQTLESVRWAYHLTRWLPWLQVIGAVSAIAGLVILIRRPPSKWRALGLVVMALLSAAVIYGSRQLYAPRIFQEIQTQAFATEPTDEVPETAIVLGVSLAGEAKAYPLNLLAYHHRLMDRVGGQDLWVTYCTMCRTGKVFRPEIDGRPLDFELIGAIRYNSVYRDRQTGTWWYQANGQAAVGELEGKTLTEVRADQMTLAQWLALHPDSQILQPDPEIGSLYETYNMHLFDQRESKDDNPMGWQWVVGVRQGEVAKAYPWSVLRRDHILSDTLGGIPISVILDSDGQSARVWVRRLGDRELELTWDEATQRFVDGPSGSSFGFDGMAEGGEHEGQVLQSLPFVIEFWHSFEYFSDGELWQAP